MANKKSKILIVEDDLDVAEMLNAYFGVQGYEVFTVNWGEDGVRACLAERPDLVILDIRLPDIDGYEVARRLRKDRRTKGVPIIFLTEKRDRADRLQGLELGADDYITKPFDIQELRLRVRNSLERMGQGSLTNPVSGLPEGALVDERLDEFLQKDGNALFFVSLENLDAFRELYGFVASDDVLRAVSLMVHNAMREIGSAKDFLGHLSVSEFALIVSEATLPALSERIVNRLEQSLDYFYPIRDRDEAVSWPNRLAIKTAQFSSNTSSFGTLAELKDELMRLKK
ncbi:MAG: response regulator [Anaerolineae bacterium]|nr:response regulator [Anaerolineae bacterium]MBT3713051.1 response regulator [Anaerolineae bacterium]MBT4311519.1 response regulator [Anaerolineae bacterium]MBT4456773.1 response regulator [Anaerolineae bacterium]MBT6062782.1 response regulator [Anaerolineae bacterium]